MIYVKDPQALAEATSAVASGSWAAVDTEADSLHHFVEKLCLLQLSVPAGDFIIDPLVGLDLQPLATELQNKHLILHGADFDLRMIRKDWDFHPKDIFDTMIAAQLLGYDKQGYADLANRHCGVALSKSGQKADWSRRPLDEKLLTYAANDTHYLKAISDTMAAELDVLSRREWHRQNCARVLKSVLSAKESEPDAERDWRVKGSKALKGRALSVLRELWNWREEEARRKDRPRFKVFNSDLLVEIAAWAEANPSADVGTMPSAPRNLRGEYREGVNRVLRHAFTLPPADMNCPPKVKGRKRLDAKENQIVTELKTEREVLGKELKIHPSLVATNAVLETLAIERPKDLEEMTRLECLLPWQIELAGARFLGVLNPRPC